MCLAFRLNGGSQLSCHIASECPSVKLGERCTQTSSGLFIFTLERQRCYSSIYTAVWKQRNCSSKGASRAPCVQLHVASAFVCRKQFFFWFFFSCIQMVHIKPCAAQGFGPNPLNRPHLHRTQINYFGPFFFPSCLFDVISDKVEMKRFVVFMWRLLTWPEWDWLHPGNEPPPPLSSVSVPPQHLLLSAHASLEAPLSLTLASLFSLT